MLISLIHHQINTGGGYGNERRPDGGGGGLLRYLADDPLYSGAADMDHHYILLI